MLFLITRRSDYSVFHLTLTHSLTHIADAVPDPLAFQMPLCVRWLALSKKLLVPGVLSSKCHAHTRTHADTALRYDSEEIRAIVIVQKLAVSDLNLASIRQ